MSQKKKLDYSLKRIAKGSYIVFIGLVLAKLFAYVYRIIVARYFGPEIYGIFSLAVIISTWFFVFSIFGINQGILRYIPLYRGKREEEKIKYLFKASFVLLLFTSFFSAVILFFLSDFIAISIFHEPELVSFLKIFSFSVPFLVLSQLCLFLILSFEKIKLYTFIHEVLQNFAMILSLVLIVFIGFKSNAIPLSYFFGVFIMFLSSFFFSRLILNRLITDKELSKIQKKHLFLEFVGYSWPFLFSGIISSMFHWTDSFMIGFLMDAKNVGIYNAAVPISLILTLTSEFFTKLFSPMVIKEYSEDKKNISLVRQLSKQVGKWIFLFNLPLFLLIFLFPNFTINLLFGKEYLSSSIPLQILLFGTFFASICTVSIKLIAMKGKSKLILINTLGVFLMNIILNFFLIPKFGLIGAAISTSVSLIFLNFLFLFQANKYLSIIPIKRKMIKILLVSLIPFTLSLFIKTSFHISSFLEHLLLISFFILLYILLIFSTSCLDKNDIMILKSIKNKLKS